MVKGNSPERAQIGAAMSFERLTKTLHSWLGVVILPWVVIMGFTGLYINHDEAILSLFPTAHYDPSRFDTAPLARPQDQAGAEQIAKRLAAGADIVLDDTEDQYHNRSVYAFTTDEFDVFVDRATGYGWTDSRYMTRTFAPDGSLLHSRIRWSRVLSSLHERGWVGRALGTWLADITAVALVVFGVSGLVLFALPRLRRRRNRRDQAARRSPGVANQR